MANKTSGETAIVDPGPSTDEVMELIKVNNLKLKYIINTHDHYDHTGGNSTLAKSTGAQIAMHQLAHSMHDIDLKDGDILNLGSLTMHVIHTPGSTSDSICILFEK